MLNISNDLSIPDISHLTEAEQNIILDVISRQKIDEQRMEKKESSLSLVGGLNESLTSHLSSSYPTSPSKFLGYSRGIINKTITNTDLFDLKDKQFDSYTYLSDKMIAGEQLPSPVPQSSPSQPIQNLDSLRQQMDEGLNAIACKIPPITDLGSAASTNIVSLLKSSFKLMGSGGGGFTNHTGDEKPRGSSFAGRGNQRRLSLGSLIKVGSTFSTSNPSLNTVKSLMEPIIITTTSNIASESWLTKRAPLSKIVSITEFAGGFRQRKSSADTGALCELCRKTKFVDGAGHICSYCKKLSCSRCGGKLPIKQSSTQSIWVCLGCRKKHQSVAKTGDWLEKVTSSDSAIMPDSARNSLTDTSSLLTLPPATPKSLNGHNHSNNSFSSSGGGVSASAVTAAYKRKSKHSTSYKNQRYLSPTPPPPPLASHLSSQQQPVSWDHLQPTTSISFSSSPTPPLFSDESSFATEDQYLLPTTTAAQHVPTSNSFGQRSTENDEIPTETHPPYRSNNINLNGSIDRNTDYKLGTMARKRTRKKEICLKGQQQPLIEAGMGTPIVNIISESATTQSESEGDDVNVTKDYLLSQRPGGPVVNHRSKSGIGIVASDTECVTVSANKPSRKSNFGVTRTNNIIINNNNKLNNHITEGSALSSETLCPAWRSDSSTLTIPTDPFVTVFNTENGIHNQHLVPSIFSDYRRHSDNVCINSSSRYPPNTTGGGKFSLLGPKSKILFNDQHADSFSSEDYFPSIKTMAYHARAQPKVTSIAAMTTKTSISFNFPSLIAPSITATSTVLVGGLMNKVIAAQEPNVDWKLSIDGNEIIGHITLYRPIPARITEEGNNFNDVASSFSDPNNCSPSKKTPTTNSTLLGLKIIGGREIYQQLPNSIDRDVKKSISMTLNNGMEDICLSPTLTKCAIVDKVKKGSIADNAKIKPGDEIVEWNGLTLRGKTYQEVSKIVSESKKETKVVFIIHRPIHSIVLPDSSYIHSNARTSNFPSVPNYLSNLSNLIDIIEVEEEEDEVYTNYENNRDLFNRQNQHEFLDAKILPALPRDIRTLGNRINDSDANFLTWYQIPGVLNVEFFLTPNVCRTRVPILTSHSNSGGISTLPTNQHSIPAAKISIRIISLSGYDLPTDIFESCSSYQARYKNQFLFPTTSSTGTPYRNLNCTRSVPIGLSFSDPSNNNNSPTTIPFFSNNNGNDITAPLKKSSFRSSSKDSPPPQPLVKSRPNIVVKCYFLYRDDIPIEFITPPPAQYSAKSRSYIWDHVFELKLKSSLQDALEYGSLRCFLCSPISSSIHGVDGKASAIKSDASASNQLVLGETYLSLRLLNLQSSGVGKIALELPLYNNTDMSFDSSNKRYVVPSSSVNANNLRITEATKGSTRSGRELFTHLEGDWGKLYPNHPPFYGNEVHLGGPSRTNYPFPFNNDNSKYSDCFKRSFQTSSPSTRSAGDSAGTNAVIRPEYYYPISAGFKPGLGYYSDREVDRYRFRPRANKEYLYSSNVPYYYNNSYRYYHEMGGGGKPGDTVFRTPTQSEHLSRSNFYRSGSDFEESIFPIEQNNHVERLSGPHLPLPTSIMPKHPGFFKRHGSTSCDYATSPTYHNAPTPESAHLFTYGEMEFQVGGERLPNMIAAPKKWASISNLGVNRNCMEGSKSFLYPQTTKTTITRENSKLRRMLPSLPGGTVPVSNIPVNRGGSGGLRSSRNKGVLIRQPSSHDDFYYEEYHLPRNEQLSILLPAAVPAPLLCPITTTTHTMQYLRPPPPLSHSPVNGGQDGAISQLNAPPRSFHPRRHQTAANRHYCKFSTARNANFYLSSSDERPDLHYGIHNRWEELKVGNENIIKVLPQTIQSNHGYFIPKRQGGRAPIYSDTEALNQKQYEEEEGDNSSNHSSSPVFNTRDTSSHVAASPHKRAADLGGNDPRGNNYNHHNNHHYHHRSASNLSTTIPTCLPEVASSGKRDGYEMMVESTEGDWEDNNNDNERDNATKFGEMKFTDGKNFIRGAGGGLAITPNNGFPKRRSISERVVAAFNKLNVSSSGGGGSGSITSYTRRRSSLVTTTTPPSNNDKDNYYKSATIDRKKQTNTVTVGSNNGTGSRSTTSTVPSYTIKSIPNGPTTVVGVVGAPISTKISPGGSAFLRKTVLLKQASKDSYDGSVSGTNARYSLSSGGSGSISSSSKLTSSLIIPNTPTPPPSLAIAKVSSTLPPVQNERSNNLRKEAIEFESKPSTSNISEKRRGPPNGHKDGSEGDCVTNFLPEEKLFPATVGAKNGATCLGLPELPYKMFIDGLGPAQIVGRQMLTSPALGDIQLSLRAAKPLLPSNLMDPSPAHAKHTSAAQSGTHVFGGGFLTEDDLRLECEIIRARGLAPPKPNAKILPAPYVKLYLLDGKRCVSKAKTTLSRRTLDPLYQQSFTFEKDWQDKILQVTLWGEYSKFERKAFMGVCQIRLDELNLISSSLFASSAAQKTDYDILSTLSSSKPVSASSKHHPHHHHHQSTAAKQHLDKTGHLISWYKLFNNTPSLSSQSSTASSNLTVPSTSGIRDSPSSSGLLSELTNSDPSRCDKIKNESPTTSSATHHKHASGKTGGGIRDRFSPKDGGNDGNSSKIMISTNKETSKQAHKK